MPEGVNVFIDGPTARVSFPDPSKKGPGLAALVATGAPIEMRTGGIRTEYLVPEGNAREAGLIDGNPVLPTVTAVVAPEGQVRRPEHPLVHTTDGRKNDSPETEAGPLEKEAEVNRQLNIEVSAPEAKVAEPVAEKKAAPAPAKKAPAKKAAAPAAEKKEASGA